jgi:amidase
VLDLAPSLDHVGPLARRVADAGAVLEVIAGPDPDDPTCRLDAPPRILAGLDDGIGGLRLGFDERYATEGVSHHLTAALTESLAVLEGLGARIVIARMPTIEADDLKAWRTICAAEALVAHRDRYPTRAASYGPWMRGFLDRATRLSAADLAAAHYRRLELCGRIAATFQHLDALACPSVLSEAFVYDRRRAYAPFTSDDGNVAGVPASWYAGSGRFTIPYDFNGYPTLSLPCGASPDGLPLSLQLVGHPLCEALLCRLGHAFEQATDWHRRHPPL